MMKRFLASALPAALIWTAAVPAAAQDALPSDCIARSDDGSLASDMADELLAEVSDAGEPLPETQDRFAAAAIACIRQHSVEEAQARPFLNANLGYFVSQEFGRRIGALGLDVAALDEVSRLLVADPNMDVDQYIDARPDLFEGPAEIAAAENGISADFITFLNGAYIGMRSLQLEGEATLSGL